MLPIRKKERKKETAHVHNLTLIKEKTKFTTPQNVVKLMFSCENLIMKKGVGINRATK